MCLSLYDYQVKANRYRNGLIYLKNRATASQNQTTTHSQKLKREGCEHKINGNHPTKKRKKKGKKEKHKIGKQGLKWKNIYQ